MIEQPVIKFFFTESENLAPVLTPEHSHGEDAGYDLKANHLESPSHPDKYDTDLLWKLEPGEMAKIYTGVGFSIPEGWYGKIFDRSSMALDGVISVGGVIDSGYCGEVLVALINVGSESVRIHRGERVAQIVFMPCFTGSLTRMSRFDLPKTERGANGFGSSGQA